MATVTLRDDEVVKITFKPCDGARRVFHVTTRMVSIQVAHLRKRCADKTPFQLTGEIFGEFAGRMVCIDSVDEADESAGLQVVQFSVKLID